MCDFNIFLSLFSFFVVRICLYVFMARFTVRDGVVSFFPNQIASIANAVSDNTALSTGPIEPLRLLGFCRTQGAITTIRHSRASLREICHFLLRIIPSSLLTT